MDPAKRRILTRWLSLRGPIRSQQDFLKLTVMSNQLSIPAHINAIKFLAGISSALSVICHQHTILMSTFRNWQGLFHALVAYCRRPISKKEARTLQWIQKAGRCWNLVNLTIRKFTDCLACYVSRDSNWCLIQHKNAITSVFCAKYWSAGNKLSQYEAINVYSSIASLTTLIDGQVAEIHVGYYWTSFVTDETFVRSLWTRNEKKDKRPNILLPSSSLFFLNRWTLYSFESPFTPITIHRLLVLSPARNVQYVVLCDWRVASTIDMTKMKWREWTA